MSNELVPWQAAIKNSERKFLDILGGDNEEAKKRFAKESMFALQAMERNAYLQKVAMGNLDSVRDAIINIAGTNITLNPAMNLAYLVPRDGVVCLDISYRGLVKLATDTGSISFVKADLVYEGDNFVYNGPAEKPDHTADVFAKSEGVERGEDKGFKGVYCIALTSGGHILTEVMTAEEIFKVRNTSMAWATKKSGPWKGWFGEMAKKTVIKRASKTWPMSEDTHFREAVQMLNEQDSDLNLIEPGPDDVTAIEMISDDDITYFEAILAENNIDKSEFLSVIAKVDKIPSIPADQVLFCKTALESLIMVRSA